MLQSGVMEQQFGCFYGNLPKPSIPPSSCGGDQENPGKRQLSSWNVFSAALSGSAIVHEGSEQQWSRASSALRSDSEAGRRAEEGKAA